MSKNFIEFTGENCDLYRVYFEDIESLKINGMDYKDFIKLKEKKVCSYKLVTYKPIMVKEYFSNFKNCYPRFYNYMDFTHLKICYGNRKYFYGVNWIGDNDYYSYGQDVLKFGDKWIYVGRKNRKTTFFKTYEFEILVKLKLGLSFGSKLTLKDIEKIESFSFNHNDFFEVNDDHYEDLSKLINLKELYISNYLEGMDYIKVAKACKKVEKLFIEDIEFRDTTILDCFANLKECYMEEYLVEDKSVFKHPLMRKKEYEHGEKSEYESYEDITIRDYEFAKRELNIYLKKKFINKKEYKRYLNCIERRLSQLRTRNLKYRRKR